MPAELCIQVSSVLQPKKLEVEFLYNQDWTADTEDELLRKVHSVLSLIREGGISFRLNIDVDVKEPEQAFFLISKKLQQQDKVMIKNHKLSIREIEVLGFIMLGYTNHQIADKLFISFETVRSHRKNILEKTGTSNTAALINYYHQTFFEK